jgi:RNA polymerase sigma-70 factor (ECF subfamily)
MGQDAFTQLVDAYYAPLYRFALSLARNSADACDLTQQTFYVWATKGSTLRDGSKVKTWLFTTLYREFLRGKRRGLRMTALDDLPSGEEEPPAAQADLALKLDAQQVVEALQEVDEAFRVSLTLFYLEDLAYQEIADLLEVPIGTVMSRLSRGKAQLRSALARKEVVSNTIPFPLSERQTL